MSGDDYEDADMSAALDASLKDSLQYYEEENDVDFALALSQSEQQSKIEEENRRERQREEEEQAKLSQALETSQREHMMQMDEQQALDMTCIEALTASLNDESNRSASANALWNSQQIKSQESWNGSWDCTDCTYRNTPFAPYCKMCKTKPGRHILTFPKLNKLKFGLEVEIIIPDGKVDGFTEEIIAQKLTEMGTKVTFEGYTHVTTQHWKIVTDASLSSSSHRDLCFELVSPVLCGEEEDHIHTNTTMESFRSIMQNIRRIGISTNSSCGFHVHVDATPNTCAIPHLATLQGLTRVCQAFVAFENAFDLLVARSSSSMTRKERAASGNQYCRSNRLICFGPSSNRQRWEQIGNAYSLQNLVNIINPNNDRYMKLNMTNIVKYNRPSTIEFRHHGGIVDLLEAEVWVRLLLRFCEYAATTESVFFKDCCLLWEGSKPQDELKALFSLVKCEGLEQFYVLDRKLFPQGDRDRGSGGQPGQQLQQQYTIKNEWSCNVCRRVFGSSRSLAQHMDATGHKNGRMRRRRR